MRDARFEKRCNFVWSKRLHFTIEIKAFKATFGDKNPCNYWV